MVVAIADTHTTLWYLFSDTDDEILVIRVIRKAKDRISLFDHAIRVRPVAMGIPVHRVVADL
jgi:hypothetical protein